MYLFVTGTLARFAALNLWLMLLPEVLTFDNTSDMWKISVNFISCCYRWWRHHQIRQKIVWRLRYQSHHLQILQIYEFAEPRPNSSGSVRVLHVNGFISVRVLHIFLHVSSSSVRFCQNAGSSSVRSFRFSSLDRGDKLQLTNKYVY